LEEVVLAVVWPLGDDRLDTRGPDALDGSAVLPPPVAADGGDFDGDAV
jgi:hypothetical protein